MVFLGLYGPLFFLVYLSRELMSDLASLRFALAAFYEALGQRDMAALDRIWARTLAVSCIHPGWPPLTDRADIIDTWDVILDNPDAQGFRCESHKIQLVGELGIVLCREWVSGHLMATTNIFAREGRCWMMVHHQASPVAMGEDEDPTEIEDWEEDWDSGSGLDQDPGHGGRLN
jgi:hypothetical protein